MSLLSVENIYKKYLDDAPYVVKDISFDLASGELLSVIGQSGSGKTTILKLIAGLEEIDKGRALFEGKPITGPSENLVPGHSEIKVVFQDFQLMPNHTVFENVAYPLRAFQESFQREQAGEMLELLQLSPFATKKPRELSGGQRQRLAIARALIEEPKVLLLDEPFSSIDVLLKDKIKETLEATLRHTSTAAILVSHDVNDVFPISDKIAVIRNGELLQLDTPKSIYEYPKSAYVAAITGSINLIDDPDFINKTGLGDSKANLVGIRPEYVQLSEGDGIKGKVLHTSYYGSHYRIEVEIGSQCHLFFYMHSNLPSVGSTVTLEIDRNKLLLFE
ncbi:MAG: ABC transporter ATP-binding protein [Bacteroidota bacterium]